MKIVLFDMDGTLTKPRQKMCSKVLNSLINLQNEGYDIGVVSGSDMNYIEEQCELMFDINMLDFEKIFWLPCNGTKRYRMLQTGKKEAVYENDMKKALGCEAYKQVIKIILDSQIAVRYGLGGDKIPLSGTFVQYRGSMINWCPIGRDASMVERTTWIDLDKKHNIRETMLRRLRSFPEMDNLEIRLGGDTSFDIFPTGWDKTYALSNFSKDDEVYFVGDRCTGTGNDREIYEAVKLRNKGQSFETTGPIKTMDIIKKSILEQRQ